MVKIGKAAPSFVGVTAYQAGEFIKVSLKDFLGGWVVLFFYPRDFTFVCPTELKGFAQQEPEFAKLNCHVVAVSTDSEWSHKAWFERDLSHVKYPVLADTAHAIARAYEVLNEDDGSAERGLFIIDTEGQIKYSLVSSGSVGRSVGETLRVLKALQSGDLCPMDWQAGEQTLGKA
jgi:alkyl hydroperoxide reductase subunit AhpC